MKSQNISRYLVTDHFPQVFDFSNGPFDGNSATTHLSKIDLKVNIEKSLIIKQAREAISSRCSCNPIFNYFGTNYH